MPTITRLSAADFRDSVKELADLLVDVVDDGFSLGFLEPFDQAAAVTWWEAREAAVADGDLVVWAAHGPDGIVGTVSLALEAKPNGRNRAEIVKLMVHRDAAARGWAGNSSPPPNVPPPARAPSCCSWTPPPAAPPRGSTSLLDGHGSASCPATPPTRPAASRTAASSTSNSPDEILESTPILESS
ncbi:hypothetical protein AB0H34_18195 [Saccharopolyspora shandongensis]|uniref:hypothetical protein n=1 Tax=Saccharopolyspora shandongensis TaxID=418495 RepID=UPI0033E51BC8